MKDFVKWLGVNEKVAKAIVWLLIIMVMLIIINTALDSVGFPHYQITYKNLKQIDSNLLINTFSSLLVCFLNFYCMVLLVFRVKETKKILKYAILYTVLNWLFKGIFNYAALQIFIISFVLLFCYLYSKKNWKYIIFGIISIFINMIIQGITYFYKANMIDFAHTSGITRSLLGIDYFIIMGVIILVKEIYLKKRSEKVCGQDQEVYYGGEHLTKKETSQKN